MNRLKIGVAMSEKVTGRIVARASRDWLDESDDEILATVIESDHPRYGPDEKLDWHRLAFALHDGYAVEIQPVTQQAPATDSVEHSGY
jgi:hypothetical protein